MTLQQLNPQPLWSIFANICAIPHPSGHEAELRQWISDYATRHSCQVKTDQAGNLLISHAASPGCGDAPRITMQAHLDMVPQKNSQYEFDFLRDAIEPYITEDGRYVTAQETTLGADNGIGVAAALAAITDATLQHGTLQVLLTIDEERGLDGAAALTADMLQTDILLNLDGEDLHQLYIGCAGGARTTATFAYTPQAIPAQVELTALRIAITGLKGGHSGADIHLGRANAHKELAALLSEAKTQFNIFLHSLSGGSADNAIPREAFALILLPAADLASFQQFIMAYRQRAQSRLAQREPDNNFSCSPTAMPDNIMPEEFADRLLKAINATPDGVIALSKQLDDLVETSTNLAIITSDHNGRVEVKSSQRSAIDDRRRRLCQALGTLWSSYGAEWQIDGEYPGWEPKPESELINSVKAAYKRCLGWEPEASAIHAGLECGILSGIQPNMDIVSFGPDISYPHSPDERVDIQSVEQFWLVLREIIQTTAQKKLS